MRLGNDLKRKLYCRQRLVLSRAIGLIVSRLKVLHLTLLNIPSHHLHRLPQRLLLKRRCWARAWLRGRR